MAEIMGGIPGGSIGEPFNMPLTAHFIGGCTIGDRPGDRRHRRLPAGLRPPRPAHRRRLRDLGQPRREPVADDHRPGGAGDVVLAQQGRGGPAPGARASYQRMSPVAPGAPGGPRGAPGALRLPIVGSALLDPESRPSQHARNPGAGPRWPGRTRPIRSLPSSGSHVQALFGQLRGQPGPGHRSVAGRALARLRAGADRLRTCRDPRSRDGAAASTTWSSSSTSAPSTPSSSPAASVRRGSTPRSSRTRCRWPTCSPEGPKAIILSGGPSSVYAARRAADRPGAVRRPGSRSSASATASR